MRYNKVPILESQTGVRYKRDIKYPKIPLSQNDIYIYTTEGDRYDILADQYYNDSKLWWIIKIANPQQPSDSYFPIPGSQLRVPQNVGNILSQYNILNEI